MGDTSVSVVVAVPVTNAASVPYAAWLEEESPIVFQVTVPALVVMLPAVRPEITGAVVSSSRSVAAVGLGGASALHPVSG